jgi:predicted GIY-YIG superfamily endonuclease
MRDFQKKEKGAYQAAIKYGWIKDITTHFKTPGNVYNRGVYVYEFPDKTAYIGLTHDFDDRHKQHLKDSKSKVFQYILKTNLQPIFKKVSIGYLPFSEAQTLEHKIINELKNSGWKVLNVATAGGLGSISPNKWDLDSLKREVEKYESITDFSVGSRSAFETAKNMGILKDLTKNMVRKRRKNLTDDELKFEVSKYTNLFDIKKNNPWVYRQLRRKPSLFQELLSQFTG